MPVRSSTALPPPFTSYLVTPDGPWPPCGAPTRRTESWQRTTPAGALNSIISAIKRFSGDHGKADDITLFCFGPVCYGETLTMRRQG